tara:strand:+ start:258 stop:1097 length:840 start_codon:yes stop_codon:yes gene_type:complete
LCVVIVCPVSVDEKKMNEVVVENRANVRWIKLNRPQVMNAITSEMLSTLNEELKKADESKETRVIVLTGEGKGFCSGLDLKQAAAGEGIGGSDLANAGARHYSTREICTVTLQRIDTPVIAALNGPAAGYGLDLALGCDIRIMSERAKLMPGFAKMGVIPESGGTWYLPRLLGWAKACEIAMLGENLSASEAESCGLINKAVAEQDFESTVNEWAEKIAANAPLAIQEMKRLFRHGLTQDFESHSHHVLMSVMNLFKSEDFKIGVKSFATKVEPKFIGK